MSTTRVFIDGAPAEVQALAGFTRAGYGHFHASGNGTVDTGSTTLNLGEWTDVNSYNNGYGFLTLEENARVTANAMILANRNSSPLAVVTLKGGTLDTKYLQKGGNNAANTGQAAVNFDGAVSRWRLLAPSPSSQAS